MIEISVNSLNELNFKFIFKIRKKLILSNALGVIYPICFAEKNFLWVKNAKSFTYWICFLGDVANDVTLAKRFFRNAQSNLFRNLHFYTDIKTKLKPVREIGNYGQKVFRMFKFSYCQQKQELYE